MSGKTKYTAMTKANKLTAEVVLARHAELAKVASSDESVKKTSIQNPTLEQIILDVIHKLRYRGEHLFAEEVENRLKNTKESL